MPSDRSFKIALFVLALFFAAYPSLAQTKKKKTSANPTTPVVAATKEEPPPVAVEGAVKRNSRPAEVPKGQVVKASKPDPLFTYEFTQPDFITSRILIEHDDAGKGTLSFSRRGGSEIFTEQIAISEAPLTRLKTAFTELNFLDSSENYQHEKDFSHLGNSKIALARGQKSRSVTINYTLNKNAKILVDEYRKIANQALWIFDVTVARENQPLDGPNQMDALDGLLKRNEISDARQLVPFLRELADDERLPLIARNHANRIVQQIEKAKK
jgi:hypothetical protein